MLSKIISRMRKGRIRYFGILCNHCMFLHVVSAICGTGSVNVDDRVQHRVALDGAVFWTGRASDITRCAESCIRRAPCRSFNYDLRQALCELNSAEAGEMPFRYGTEGLLYSSISQWLSEFDPACASRPCTENQVCMPGQLGQSDPGGNCSYFCIDMPVLCPKPYPDFSGNRSVGAAATVTCPRGEIGGGTAECLNTQQWNDTLKQCTDVYGMSCTNASECIFIDGDCTGGMCLCPSRMEYDNGTKMCIWDLYLDPCVNQIDCLEMHGVCESGNCTCPPTRPYNNVTRVCGSIFKLVPGIGGNGINSGQLHIFHNGQWKNVCNKHWTWTVTKAVCREINSSYVFGGAFHDSFVYGQGASSDPTVELHDVDCGSDGTTASFVDCANQGVIKDCDHDKDLGLTCYESDMTASVRFNYSYNGTNSEHLLEVQYGGVWGAVCGTGWKDSAAGVACPTLTPSAPEVDKSCISCCAGGYGGPYMIDSITCDGSETSLFFCKNGGWNKTYSCGSNEVCFKCK